MLFSLAPARWARLGHELQPWYLFWWKPGLSPWICLIVKVTGSVLIHLRLDPRARTLGLGDLGTVLIPSLSGVWRCISCSVLWFLGTEDVCMVWTGRLGYPRL